MANEVWSAEPGIYVYGVGGFRHDDTVIVGRINRNWLLLAKNLEDQTIKA